jgi:hypothetical protein
MEDDRERKLKLIKQCEESDKSNYSKYIKVTIFYI